MKKLRSLNWGIIALLGAVVLLALAGLGLLGAYFFPANRSTPADGWANPINAVVSDRVAPDLAVLTLAGEPDERVARAALDAGEVETAYATLAYSVFLPDNVRSGQWLLLARQYQTLDPARATVCYQAALDHVALAPTLSDLARADVSLQVARGYASIEKAWISKLALAQAENIARYSVMLLPAQRRTLLGQVAAAYDALGDAQAAQAIRQNLDAYAAGSGVVMPPGQPFLPTLRGSIVLPEAVTAALAVRQQAAASLAARWLSAAPSARGTLTQALSEALLAEDAARAELYATAEARPLAERLALLHDQIAWLTIKERVARGAYGLPLAPEWAGQAAERESALAGAFTALINGYGQQLDTLDAVEALQARVELLRQGLLWARLGLFGGNAETLLSEQLADASRQLWTRQGGAGLTVVAQDVQGQRFYLLAGTTQ